jgi:transcriptional regulator with XRE-family HTH domain
MIGCRTRSVKDLLDGLPSREPGFGDVAEKLFLHNYLGDRRMAKFGDLLRDLRKSRGLSQSGLAGKLGWNQSKVSYLEGTEEVPKEDDLRAVCRCFSVRPEYFYERREDRKPRALNYLRALASASPEQSPKAAIAFYSQVDELAKDEQKQVVELVRKSSRSGPKR